MRREVNETIARVTAWSMEIASEGTSPQVGFEGEEFQSGTYRYDMRGQKLANGWKNFGDGKSANILLGALGYPRGVVVV